MVYLTKVDINSNANKFWQVEVSDKILTCSWGRIGYKAQSKVYHQLSQAHAQQKCNLLVEQKIKKGYQLSQPNPDSIDLLKIEEALELLKKMESFIANKDFSNPQFLGLLNSFLQIIPSPLGMKINPALVYKNYAELEHQRKILKKLCNKNGKAVSLKTISTDFWRF
jgi:predicted DNA-binding WGR domain protein